MAPLCSQSDPRRNPQTTKEKRKHRIERDRVRHAAETADQKEHRVIPGQDRVRCVARAAAEVVSHSHRRNARLLLRRQRSCQLLR